MKAQNINLSDDELIVSGTESGIQLMRPMLRRKDIDHLYTGISFEGLANLATNIKSIPVKGKRLFRTNSGSVEVLRISESIIALPGWGYMQDEQIKSISFRINIDTIHTLFDLAFRSEICGMDITEIDFDIMFIYLNKSNWELIYRDI